MTDETKNYYEKTLKATRLALEKACEHIKKREPAYEDFNLVSYFFAISLIEIEEGTEDGRVSEE